MFLSDPSLFLNTQPVILRAYIKSIAKANYIELNGLDDIKKLVHQSGDSIRGGITFAVEMATLGCFPRHILESVLDLGYIQRVIRKGETHMSLNIKYHTKLKVKIISSSNFVGTG